MTALQPRTTLDGRPFDVTKAELVRPGLTERQVRDLLGDPWQTLPQGHERVWRYYERFTPRGCDPPTLSQEFRVRFLNGVVVSSEAARPKVKG